MLALSSLLLLATPIASLKPHSVLQKKPDEWVVEGGKFADFFNKRTKGRGIHKWVQYFPAYNRHFKKFIDEEVHIVEIGIQSGGSLDMWEGVFGPRAHVYGIDINPNTKQYEDARTKVYIGDQANRSFWSEFRKQVPRVDILIDDGGHEVNQMLVTMSEMLPCLSSKGVYMNEDIHEGNAFWTSIPYDLLSKHVGSLHIYPYLFVAEMDKALDVLRHLGTTSVFLSSGSFQLPLPEMNPLPDSCRQASKVDVPTASCLNSAVPQSALVYTSQSKDLASSKGLLSSPSCLQLHKGSTCCETAPNTLQQSLDSVHVYPQFIVFKKTLSNEGRHIQAPQHGTQWIPYAGNGPRVDVKH